MRGKLFVIALFVALLAVPVHAQSATPTPAPGVSEAQNQVDNLTEQQQAAQQRLNDAAVQLQAAKQNYDSAQQGIDDANRLLQLSRQYLQAQQGQQAIQAASDALNLVQQAQRQVSDGTQNVEAAQSIIKQQSDDNAQLRTDLQAARVTIAELRGQINTANLKTQSAQDDMKRTLGESSTATFNGFVIGAVSMLVLGIIAAVAFDLWNNRSKPGDETETSATPAFVVQIPVSEASHTTINDTVGQDATR